MENKDWKIWISYHNDDLVQQYGLTEDENHILFATHKIPLNENINRLSSVYCELVTMYYVWKNQVKSDYVGFNHYRRKFNIKGFPENGTCQVFDCVRFNRRTIYTQYNVSHNIKDMDLMIDILNDKFGDDNIYTKYIKNDTTMITCNCFFINWDDFNDLCEFLFPLLEEFSQRNGFGKIEDNTVDQWIEKTKKYFNENDVNYQKRCPAFISERLIGIWLKINMKCYM